MPKFYLHVLLILQFEIMNKVKNKISTNEKENIVSLLQFMIFT